MALPKNIMYKCTITKLPFTVIFSLAELSVDADTAGERWSGGCTHCQCPPGLLIDDREGDKL